VGACLITWIFHLHWRSQATFGERHETCVSYETSANLTPRPPLWCPRQDAVTQAGRHIRSCGSERMGLWGSRMCSHSCVRSSTWPFRLQGKVSNLIETIQQAFPSDWLFTPALKAHVSPDQWPSIAEMRSHGARVLLINRRDFGAAANALMFRKCAPGNCCESWCFDAV